MPLMIPFFNLTLELATSLVELSVGGDTIGLSSWPLNLKFPLSDNRTYVFGLFKFAKLIRALGPGPEFGLIA